MTTFAPANRESGERNRLKVHRHIELTAVFSSDVKNK